MIAETILKFSIVFINFALVGISWSDIVTMSTQGAIENCLGWAARDASGVLSPYQFSRRYEWTNCFPCYNFVSLVSNHFMQLVIRWIHRKAQPQDHNVKLFTIGFNDWNIITGPYIYPTKWCYLSAVLAKYYVHHKKLKIVYKILDIARPWNSCFLIFISWR